MRKRITTALALMLAAVGVTFAIAAPASASLSCTNHVWHSASWGTARVCITNVNPNGSRNFQVTYRDILTDGYCVHPEFEYTWDPGHWYVEDAVANCGAPASVWPSVVTEIYSLKTVRLVRGNPVYLWPACDCWDGHGTGNAWIVPWPD